jgi:chaperone required for assembly of F1-ATPase
VRLDDKPVRTPAGRLLAAPTLALAEALAAEWEAQRDAPVAEEVARYLASDLICYRAGSPRGLVERQALHWDPIVEWARDALGARMLLAEGVVHVTQPETALAAAGAAIPGDPWRLGALHSVTTLTGSALLALALARGRITADEAWAAAHVDEDWNIGGAPRASAPSHLGGPDGLLFHHQPVFPRIIHRAAAPQKPSPNASESRFNNPVIANRCQT